MFDNDDFQKNLLSMQERIKNACSRSGKNPDSVRIIAVTKNHPSETAQAVIDAGIADIGENRVQEILQKTPQLHGIRCIHMIGHLQSNKVIKVVPLVDWIQSVDSVHLLEKIESACRLLNKKINVLVQVNTSGEQTKSGCKIDDARQLCERCASSDAVVFNGMMTIGPLGAVESSIRHSFTTLRRLGEQCSDFTEKMELSMGMSDDFEWAIEEGATMVRIGSLLLGRRQQQYRLPPDCSEPSGNTI
jgi:pyridoxal phosphate enzyme (YggS family)